MTSYRCIEAVAARLGWTPARVLRAQPDELVAADTGATRPTTRARHERRPTMPHVDQALASRVLEAVNEGAARPLTRDELLKRCPTNEKLRSWETRAAELRVQRAAERAERSRAAQLAALGSRAAASDTRTKEERDLLAAVSPSPGAQASELEALAAL